MCWTWNARSLEYNVEHRSPFSFHSATDFFDHSRLPLLKNKWLNCNFSFTDRARSFRFFLLPLFKEFARNYSPSQNNCFLETLFLGKRNRANHYAVGSLYMCLRYSCFRISAVLFQYGISGNFQERNPRV